MQERLDLIEESYEGEFLGESCVAVLKSSYVRLKKKDKEFREMFLGKGKINKIDGIILIYLKMRYDKGKELSKEKKGNRNFM